ncbi:MAG TPA: lipid A export permease/ATP-binding protein MsbA [Povalibacter sp.]|uniref:lipid A export permease/ATP-binding protein MsbA n=1 Tax=Povalibacter sp. TaxID=1962978 RepID=UPI002CC0790C|nr:lipid A export permease/ATP-binding protein MsbA [Povalibacter sp.]HMN44805.1 lipid A export permease/ATP-binding protein MsbA [Povalibacter sp.]
MTPNQQGRAPGTVTPWETYRRLLGYLRPHRGMFALGILGAMLFSATMVSFTGFAKIFGDDIFENPSPRMVVLLPFGLVVLFVLRGIADFTQTYCMGYVGRHIVKRLRAQIFDRLMLLPLTYSDRHSSAALQSTLTFNTEQVGQAATDSVVVFVREALTIVGLIASLFYYNARLAMIALTMGPLLAWLVTLINRKFRRYGRRIQDSVGDITRVAKETLDAPRIIKIYNAQDYQGRQFEAVNERNRRSVMRMVLTKGLSNPIVQMVMAVGSAFVLSIALSDRVEGRMTGGDLLAFLTSLAMITQPLRSLVGVAGPIQQGIAAGQSIFEIIDEPAEPAGGTLKPERVRGEIDFDAVSFSYFGGQGAALRDVDLHIAAGEMVAIVGRSGSGKSTLVSLLPRFYDVDSGAIRVDGRDTREYDLAGLREQIALVSQDVVLFNDTIRANIAFGREVSGEAIEGAATAAHVMEFVNQLPVGLDTVVGDRGVLLSGGQRQRISIARALLKNAPILILDEATSALDTESERIIQGALERLMENRTTLVIAHRLSTVEKADRIIVMDGGRIVESGTHGELIARNGQYAALHRMQFSA